MRFRYLQDYFNIYLATKRYHQFYLNDYCG